MKSLIELERKLNNPDNVLGESQGNPVEPQFLSLGDIEHAKFKRSWWDNSFGAMWTGAGKGFKSTPQFFGNTIRIMGGVATPFEESWPKSIHKATIGKLFPGLTAFNERVESRMTNFGKTLDKVGTGFVERNQEWMQEKYGTPENRVEQFFTDVGTGAYSAGSAIGLMAVGGSLLVLTGFGLIEGTDKYAELVDADVGIDKALVGATLSGIAEGSIEALSTYLLWNATLPWLGRGILNAGLEGTEEVLQTTSSETFSFVFGGKEFKGWESVKQVVGSSLYSGAIGVIVGGPAGMGVALGQRNRIADIYEKGGLPKKQAVKQADADMAKTTTQMLDYLENDLFSQMANEKRVVMDAATGKPLTIEARNTLEETYKRYVANGLIEDTTQEMTDKEMTDTIIASDEIFFAKQRGEEIENPVVNAEDYIKAEEEAISPTEAPIVEPESIPQGKEGIVEPLVEEAKKFDTAEEFVASQDKRIVEIQYGKNAKLVGTNLWVTITPSAKQVGKFQVTTFDKNNIPQGDFQAKTFEEALQRGLDEAGLIGKEELQAALDAGFLKREELSKEELDTVDTQLTKQQLTDIFNKAQGEAKKPKVTRAEKFEQIKQRIVDIKEKKLEVGEKEKTIKNTIKSIKEELAEFKNNIKLSPTGIYGDIFDTLNKIFKNVKKGTVLIDEASVKAGFGEDMDSFVQYLNDMDNFLVQLQEEAFVLKEQIAEQTQKKVVKSELQYLKDKISAYTQGKLEGAKELQAVKKHLGQTMKKVLPPHERGKALSILQNVTQKNLGKSMARIENIYQDYQLKLARTKAAKKLIKGYKHPENVLDVRYQEVIDNVRQKIGQTKTERRKTIKDMSTDEIVKLANTISQLEVKGKEIFKNRAEAMAMAREILRAGVIQAAGGEVDAGVIGSYEERKAKKGITKIRLAAMRPLNLVRELFGKFGEETFYDVIDYAETIKAAGIFDRISRIRAAFRKHIAPKVPLGEAMGQHKLGSAVTIDGVTFQLNDTLSFYAQRNNEKAKAAIINGNNISEETFNKFIKYLEENHPNYIKFADTVKEIVGDRYDAAKQEMNDVFNVKMPKEEDYWPMFRIRTDYAEDPESKFAMDLLSDADTRTIGGIDYASLEKGFTFGRKDIADRNQKPISLDFMGDAIRAIETQEHFINYAKVQKMYNGLKSDEAVRLSVTYNKGANAWQSFDKYMNEAINPRIIFRGLDPISMRVKTIRKALGVGFLGFNVVTALKQFPSAHLALKYTNLPRLYSSMVKVMFNPKLREKIYKLDPTIKNRVINRDINDFAKNYPKLAQNDIIRGLQISQDIIGKKAFDMIMMMDKWAVLSVYNSVYEYQRRTAGDAEARKIAHKAVLETQPQGRMIDLPEIYRTNNEMLRMMLMFTNQLNQIYNMMTESTRQEFGRGEYKRIMMSFASIMASSFMIYMASHGGKWPEDEEDQMWAFIDVFLGSSISSIPIVGNLAMSYGRGYTPSISPADSIIKSLKRTMYNWKNEEYAEAAIETLINVGILAGVRIPSAQPRRFIKGAIDLLDKETEDPRRLIWSKHALFEND